jgi:Na+/proline symporter
MVRVRSELAKWSDNTKLAILGVGYVLQRWRFASLAVAIAIGFAFILTLVTSGSTDVKLLVSAISLPDKLLVLGSVFIRVFTNLTSPAGLLVGLLSLLQGITLALLVFNYREQRKLDSQSAADSGIAAIIAVFGLGCSACGTSLLMPLITLFFSSGAFAIAEVVGHLTTLAAFMLVLYALRRLGLTSFVTITANHRRKGSQP